MKERGIRVRGMEADFRLTVLELMVYPAIHEIWKWHFELKRAVGPA